MKSSKARILLCILLCLMLIYADAIPIFARYQAPTALIYQNESDGSNESVNGEYIISIFKNRQWQEVGRLGFDMLLEEKTLDLSSVLRSNSPADVRIVQDGGNAAHLDSVFLGGETPQSANFNDGILLLKLSKKDFDLINVASGGIELVFPENRLSDILSVTGRIDGEIISREPFKLPSSNNFKTIDESSEFYSYKLNSTRRELVADAILDEIEGLEPFFKEYITPGNGYPAGYIYGWVMNTDEHLNIVLDVTTDNILDGDKGYAKVYVKTNTGIKEFKVSVPETAWGKPAFTYTDKVDYEHKVYEFRIPLEEIAAAGSSTFNLAFSVYGTMALVDDIKNLP